MTKEKRVSIKESVVVMDLFVERPVGGEWEFIVLEILPGGMIK